MEYIKYHSIEHWGKFKKSAERKFDLSGNVVYTIREKVHGANFKAFYEGEGVESVVFGTRERRLETEQDHHDFYRFDSIRDRVAQKIVDLYRRLEMFDPSITTMEVYGELAGDMPNGKGIQKGVKYGPMDFYVFDICLNGTWWLTDIQVETACAPIMRTAPMLGVYHQLESFDSVSPDFESRVIRKEGLPSGMLSVDENAAEGYIIKAERDGMAINRTDRHGTFFRFIAKNKGAKWSEKNKTAAAAAKNSKLTDDENKIVADVAQYINENRVRSVMSKMLPTEFNFAKIAGLTVADAIQDYATAVNDESVDWACITDGMNGSQMKKTLHGIASDVLRPIWLELQDQDDE